MTLIRYVVPAEAVYDTGDNTLLDCKFYLTDLSFFNENGHFLRRGNTRNSWTHHVSIFLKTIILSLITFFVTLFVMAILLQRISDKEKCFMVKKSLV